MFFVISILMLVFYEKLWEVMIFLYGILIFKIIFILEGFVLNVIFECDIFSIYFIVLSLLVVLMIILGCGYRIERFQARLYILLYTLVASLPFLFLLIEIYYILDTFFFFFFYY